MIKSNQYLIYETSETLQNYSSIKEIHPLQYGTFTENKVNLVTDKEESQNPLFEFCATQSIVHR